MIFLIKAAVFDLDHTLFDRYATIREIVKIMDADSCPFKADIPRDTIADIYEYCDRNFVHFGWYRMYDEFSARGVLKDEIEKTDFFKLHIQPLYMLAAVPFSFTVSTIKKIKDMGLKVGLITNGKHNLQYRKLELLGIRDMFDEIIVSEDFGADKPDLRIFEEMARRMKLHPSEMLYIGDNPENDIEPSRTVGYTPVWIKTTGNWVFPQIKKPEFTADTVAEIPKIIEKLRERDKQ